MISRGSRSTSAESTARRSGNVTSAPRSTLFNRIGRLTLRFAAPESTNVIVALCFQGFVFVSFLCNNVSIAIFGDLGFVKVLFLVVVFCCFLKEG